MPTRSAAVLAVALALSACSGDPQSVETVTVTADSSTDAASPTPATSSASPSPDAEASTTPTPTPSSPPPNPSPSSTPANTGGPGTYPDGEAGLELSQDHPNGTTLDLTRIAVEANTMVVDVSAINASPIEVYLANGGDTRAITAVVDGQSPSLLFRPAADNPNLTIPSGSELTGTVAFVGRIPPDATTVTITFNALLGDGDNDGTPAPMFVFDDVALP